MNAVQERHTVVKRVGFVSDAPSSPAAPPLLPAPLCAPFLLPDSPLGADTCQSRSDC